MPLLAALLAFVLIAAIAALSVPLAIVQRYRVGTARRPARGWIATINLVAASISACLLLATAAASSVWIPKAIPWTLAGFAAGFALGLLGLLLTRWEQTHALHYTPSRLLVLTITLLVLARLAWGIWRGVRAWGAPSASTFLAEAGAAGSMAAGAVILGYYVVYWLGVRRRIRRHRAR